EMSFGIPQQFIEVISHAEVTGRLADASALLLGNRKSSIRCGCQDAIGICESGIVAPQTAPRVVQLAKPTLRKSAFCRQLNRVISTYRLRIIKCRRRSGSSRQSCSQALACIGIDEPWHSIDRCKQIFDGSAYVIS